MELDELRRYWRQSEPAAPPALSGDKLDALLKGRTINLVEKMRLAAWLETGLAVLIAIGCLVVLPQTQNDLVQFYAWASLVLMGILLVYYYRMLRVLKRMAELTGSVRGHLGTLAQGLRHLLRFYYRFTLATTPVLLTLVTGFMLWKATQRHHGLPWQVVAMVGGLGLVIGGLGQVGIVYLSRWWLQRLYGCHLDRLESQLRELDDSPVTD